MSKTVILVYPGLRQNRNEGSKNRLYSFIESYKELGYKVIVLAFVKDRRSGRDVVDSGVKWIKLPFILPLAKNKILSNILMGYMRLILAFLTRIYKPQIVQCEMYSIASKSLCKRAGVTYITDFHGDMFNEVVEMGLKSRQHWFSKYLVKLQAFSIANSDVVIVVSSQLLKQLEQNTNRNVGRSFIISCGVEPSRFNVPAATIPDLNLDNRLVVGYCGGLQKWQNVEKILNIVNELHNRDQRVFFFMFTGDDTNPFDAKLKELGESNYKVKSLSFSEVPAHLKLLDAGFLIRDNLILNKVSSPTKIEEYLMAGAALVCTEYSGDYKMVTRDDNCVVVDVDNINYPELLSRLWNYKLKTDKDVTYLTQFSFANMFKSFIESINSVR